MKRFSHSGRVCLASLLAVPLCLAALVALPGCDSFDNPNAASSDQVLTTTEGLRALAIGMRREYAVEALSSVVRVSGLASREFGVVVGFTNPQDIERGGPAVLPDNGIVNGVWLNHYQVIGMAEQIIDNVGNVPDPATRSALRATAHFFKAASLGNLAMFYEAFPLTVDEAGKAPFASRTEGLQEAVRLLEEGIAALGGQDVSDGFKSRVLGSTRFNLLQSQYAYLARYHTMLGNHQQAIQAANNALANPASVSVFVYDNGNGNENPLYVQTTQLPATLRPLDNFGFDPTEFTVPAADGRKAFFLAPLDAIGETSRLPVETMLGFYDTVNEAIPVYLPGEMYLIIAEANARLNQIPAAITALNQVRTKANDPFGVNAGLAPYSGPQTQAAVLEEIYRQRRIELFVTGLALEDSRRFGRPAPPNPPSFASFARTRNFFPYPDNERANNPNTPADPAI